MLNKFLGVVNDISGKISPRRFSKGYFINKDVEYLWDWFESVLLKFVGYSNRDVLTLLAHNYTEPPKCIVCCCNAKVQRYSDHTSFDYCSKSCAMVSTVRAQKISNTKNANTQEKNKNINEKRSITMIEKYGVSYNSQRPEVKIILTEKLSKHHLHNGARELLMDEDWLYREYVTKNRSGVDIADEINVYYGTVLDYCRKYGFPIQKNYNDSLPQKQIYEFILDNYTGVVIYNDWSVLGNKEIDIYLPELHLAIEHNGLPYHSSNIKCKKNQYRHIEKTNACLEKGIQLIHIRGDQWILNRAIVESILLNKIGVTPNRIFARKCTIVSLDNKTTKLFFDVNHMQGNCVSSIRYGLEYDNKIVAVMTFGKSRYNKTAVWELLRFANKINTTVIGGFSKLLKHFENDYDGSIVSYCDRTRGSGGVYTNNGFNLVYGKIKPGYSWTNNHTVYNRLRFTRVTIGKYLSIVDETKTVDENMFNNKYRIIYDAGQLTFIKTR